MPKLDLLMLIVLMINNLKIIVLCFKVSLDSGWTFFQSENLVFIPKYGFCGEVTDYDPTASLQLRVNFCDTEDEGPFYCPFRIRVRELVFISLEWRHSRERASD